MRLRHQIIYVLIAYPFGVFAVDYILVCQDPYWYDNSPRAEYIPLADRWQFALLAVLQKSAIEWMPILGLIILALWWIDRYH